MVGLDDRIVRANEALGSLLGRHPASLEGERFDALMVFESRDRWRERLARDGGLDTPCRFALLPSGGAPPVEADIVVRRCPAEAGRRRVLVNPVAHSSGSARLPDRDPGFQAFFDRAAVGLAQVGIDGRWLRVNPKLCEITGYAADELGGMTFQDITHPDDLQTDLTLVADLMAGRRESYTLEKRYIRRDGRVVWIRLTVAAVRDDAGAPKYFTSVVEDITPRRQAESALRMSEERLRLALLAANQGLFDVDLRTGRTVLSPEYMHMLGHDRAEAEMPLDTVRAWRHPDSAARMEQVFAEYRSGRRDSHREELRQQTASGDWLWVLSVGKAVERDGSGAVTRVIGTNSDISESKRLEESLRREESRLRQLISAAPHGALVVGASGEIELVNDRLASLFGYEPGELVGRPIEQLVPESMRGEHVGKRSAFLAAPEARILGAGRDVVGQRKDGTSVPIEIGLAPVESGDRRFVLATVIDITSRREAERVLRQSEQQFRELAEGLPQLTWTCTADGDCDFLSRRWEDYTGKPASEQLGARWMEQVHPDDRARLGATWSDCVASGNDLAVEFRIRRADGVYRWFDTRARPIRRGDGHVVKWVGSNTDVHDLREVRDRLKDSEERLRLALFATHQGLYDLDMRTGRLVITPEYARILGVDFPDELRDVASLRPFRHPDENARVEQMYAEYWNGSRSRHDIELRMITRSGEPIWVRSVGQVIERDEQGNPVRLIGIQTDITARKRAEEALTQERTLLRTLIDTIPDNVFTKDLQGRFHICNIAAVGHLGFASEREVEGRTVRDLFPASMADVYDADDARAFGGETVVNEAEVSQNAAGDIGVYHTIKAPLRDTQGRIVGLVGVSRNVTERTRAAEALRASEEQLRQAVQELRRQTAALAERNRELVETQAALAEAARFNEEILGSVQVGIIVYDRDLVCVARNAFMESFSGLPNERVVGHSLLETSAGMEAHDIRRVIDRVLEGEAVAIDHYVGRIRGTTEILPPDTGDPDDPDVLWTYLAYQPKRSASGEIVGVIASVLDATARHRAETQLRRLNAQLEDRIRERTLELQAANRELETFAYSVSHDLKAPLRGIDGYSRLIEEDYAERLDGEGRLFLGNIRTGILQMSALIDDLLAYSRMERQKLQQRSVDLDAVLRSVTEEFRHEIEAGGVQLHVEGPLPAVRGDPQGVRIVLRNVLQNAIRFSRDATPPVITVSADQGARLQVRDNGIGFDMKFHDRIFEIFQRLQRAEDYPGTGVGLALVRKAMQRMGGRVWARSAPGEGATFFLEFRQ